MTSTAGRVEPEEVIATQCCIAGGGPCGIMLGFLLARAGVDVTVLEKHADFLRDFRGDTIHPSTLEVLHELGLLDDFLSRPHQKLCHIEATMGQSEVTIADFSHLPTKCKFIAFMPQWDFLNFLVEHAKRYTTFHLRMEAQVTAVLRQEGRVTGVRARLPEGSLRVEAQLTIGADGRGSVVREQAGLRILDLGSPIDVLWMKLSKAAGDPVQTLGRVSGGRIAVLIDRDNYWQCAYLIRKGGFAALQQRGLAAFKNELGSVVPYLGERVNELTDWSYIKLLTVRVDRLRRWYRPGLLCVGDAAHAMSPVGGVGINLAIQDAVAAANILGRPLLNGTLRTAHLRAVQRRRQLPTRLVQSVQVFVQNKIIDDVLESRNTGAALPWPLRLLRRWPRLRRIPARLVGLGFRPEHVRTRKGA